MSNKTNSTGRCGSRGNVIYNSLPKKRRCLPVNNGCPDNNNTNTINFNPIIQIPGLTPDNGGQGLVTGFDFVNVDGVGLGENPALLTPNPLILNINNTTDRVLLNGTVEWRTISNTRIIIILERIRPGEVDFSEIVTIFDTGFESDTVGDFTYITTTFTEVDDQPTISNTPQQVEYRLTARVESIDGSTGVTRGTLTGTVIKANP